MTKILTVRSSLSTQLGSKKSHLDQNLVEMALALIQKRCMNPGQSKQEKIKVYRLTFLFLFYVCFGKLLRHWIDARFPQTV